MKKTQKQFFGCFGLGLVATMTAVAITLPSPQASAITDPDAVQDVIQLKVVDDTPTIGDITAVDSNGDAIPQGGATTDPNITFKIDYANIGDLEFNLSYTYTNSEGTHTVVFDNIFGDYDADYEIGDIERVLNLDSEQFNVGDTDGYGHYVLTVTGTGITGAIEERVFQFSHAPFDVTSEQNQDNGKIDTIISNTNTDVVSKVDIIIDGESAGSNIPVGEEGTVINHYIPEHITEEKDVIVKIIAKDSDGNIIYVGQMTIHFDPGILSPTGVPDTGGLFSGLNISREDYLVTGLIAFFVVGVVGFGIVARGRRANSCRTSGRANGKTTRRSASRTNKSQARSKSNKRR